MTALLNKHVLMSPGCGDNQIQVNPLDARCGWISIIIPHLQMGTLTTDMEGYLAQGHTQ